MSNRFKIFIVIVICLLTANLKAQDKILFLNGKVMEGTLLEKNNYEFTFKLKEKKQFLIDKFRVFSYTQKNKEHIVYEYDTLSGNFLKTKDMKMFVYGEKNAYETYKPNASNALGLFFGAAAGYLMHNESPFIYIAVPLIYTPITLFFPTKVNQKRLSKVKYLKEDEYLRGYERVARLQRTQGALRSSILGFITGYLVSAIVNKNKK
jgi:hypothetical protein